MFNQQQLISLAVILVVFVVGLIGISIWMLRNKKKEEDGKGRQRPDRPKGKEAPAKEEKSGKQGKQDRVPQKGKDTGKDRKEDKDDKSGKKDRKKRRQVEEVEESTGTGRVSKRAPSTLAPVKAEEPTRQTTPSVPHQVPERAPSLSTPVASDYIPDYTGDDDSVPDLHWNLAAERSEPRPAGKSPEKSDMDSEDQIDFGLESLESADKEVGTATRILNTRDLLGSATASPSTSGSRSGASSAPTSDSMEINLEDLAGVVEPLDSFDADDLRPGTVDLEADAIDEELADFGMGSDAVAPRVTAIDDDDMDDLDLESLALAAAGDTESESQAAEEEEGLGEFLDSFQSGSAPQAEGFFDESAEPDFDTPTATREEDSLSFHEQFLSPKADSPTGNDDDEEISLEEMELEAEAERAEATRPASDIDSSDLFESESEADEPVSLDSSEDSVAAEDAFASQAVFDADLDDDEPAGSDLDSELDSDQDDSPVFAVADDGDDEVDLDLEHLAAVAAGDHGGGNEEDFESVVDGDSDDIGDMANMASADALDEGLGDGLDDDAGVGSLTSMTSLTDDDDDVVVAFDDEEDLGVGIGSVNDDLGIEGLLDDEDDINLDDLDLDDDDEDLSGVIGHAEEENQEGESAASIFGNDWLTEVLDEVEVKPKKKKKHEAGTVKKKKKPVVVAAPQEDLLAKSQERARRLARTIARDIKNYNGEKLANGLAMGSITAALRNEIEKAKSFYLEEAPKDLPTPLHYFYEGLVEVLANGDESLVDKF